VSYSFYVWYRVGRDEPDTERAVRGMMARLSCRSGVAGRLLRKYREPGLWMEVYEGIDDPDAFALELTRLVDQYDLEMFVDGSRHTECFEAGDAVSPACGPHRTSI